MLVSFIAVFPTRHLQQFLSLSLSLAPPLASCLSGLIRDTLTAVTAASVKAAHRRALRSAPRHREKCSPPEGPSAQGSQALLFPKKRRLFRQGLVSPRHPRVCASPRSQGARVTGGLRFQLAQWRWRWVRSQDSRVAPHLGGSLGRVSAPLGACSSSGNTLRV